MLIQLAKGLRKTVHSAITVTTTSEPQLANGHNAMILYCEFTTGAGTWTIKIQGKSPSGTYIDVYDLNNTIMALSEITASRSRIYVGIPENFRIVATEDSNGATVTVGYELISV